MKKPFFTFLLVSFLVAFSSPLFSLDISGNWDMKSASRFSVSIRQQGESAKGSYSFSGHKGEIVGLIYDGLLVGFWFQDAGPKKCKTLRNGTYYWGTMMLEFTDTTVQGKDGNCGDAPSSPWTGKKLP